MTSLDPGRARRTVLVAQFPVGRVEPERAPWVLHPELPDDTNMQYFELVLPAGTLLLALATFWMAFATRRLAKIAREDFRAARLPAIDLKWRLDDPTTGFVGVSEAQGRRTHSISIGCEISTLSPSIPTFLEQVQVEIAPIPPKNRKPRFGPLDESHPLLYLPDDGWIYPYLPAIEVDWPSGKEASVIAPPVDADPHTCTKPVRLIKVSAVVSTASADAPPERWTSLSVVMNGIDFHVERRLPFLREKSASYRQRWNESLGQILRECRES